MKNYKFLCGMTSYKRPNDCIRQINHFMSMGYKEMKMSVVVRGCDLETYEKLIYPEVKKYVDENKLIISFTNENFSFIPRDLCETITQAKDYDYDYFCKIDDDDWYVSMYLAAVNQYLNENPNSSGCWVDGDYINMICNHINGTVVTRKSTLGILGGSLVCNYRISKIFEEVGWNYDKMDSIILDKYKIFFSDYYQVKSTKMDDNLLHRLIVYGRINNEISGGIKKHGLFAINRINSGCLLRKTIND